MKKKLTGDNYPHTNMMTLDEWYKFVRHFKVSWGNRYEIKDYLIEEVDTPFKTFIYKAFICDNEFYKIAERTKPVQ
jgi:hypothetical protein